MIKGVCLQTISSVQSCHFDEIDNNTNNNNSRKILQVLLVLTRARKQHSLYVCFKSDNIAYVYGWGILILYANKLFLVGPNYTLLILLMSIMNHNSGS